MKIQSQLLNESSRSGHATETSPTLKARVGADVQRLASRFPQLTPLELRICVFCKYEYTSMKIASELGISDKTVDNHRSLIRKKLGLDRDTRLDSFLIGLIDPEHADQGRLP